MDLSIIITSYNYASFIEQCIESCILQNDTYLNYEIIVVDDGSSDATPFLLENINHKIKNIGRRLQDLNLCGYDPEDFKSSTLTTRSKRHNNIFTILCILLFYLVWINR